MDSRTDVVLTALVTRFRAVLPAATTVFDGPTPVGSTPPDYVIVGGGDPDGDTAATMGQARSTMGAGRWRDESGEVACTAVAWSGDTDIAPLRIRVLATAALCQQTIRDDPTLGGVLAQVDIGAETVGARLMQEQNEAGAVARVVFTVTYQALLT